jgi:predicted membrane-bound spermidine synthase
MGLQHEGAPTLPALDVYWSELKFALWLGGLLLLLALLLPLTGITYSIADLLEMNFRQGVSFVMLGLLGQFVFLLFAFSRPPRAEWSGVLAGGALYGLVYYAFGPELQLPQLHRVYPLLLVSEGLGLCAVVAVALRAWRARGETRARARLLLAVFLVPLLFTMYPQIFLQLTEALHPSTYDVMLYHFEATLGFQPSAVLALAVNAIPGMPLLLLLAYGALPLGFSVLYAAQMGLDRPPKVNLLALWVVSGLVTVMVAYHVFPATGPRDAFGDNFYLAMNAYERLPFEKFLVQPMPRNAMPSMHVGWALLMWLNACLIGNRWLRAGFALLLGLNVLATLGLGHHYLIDLVVAVPFSLAFQAMFLRRLPWNHRDRLVVIGLGLSLWIGWLIALRFGIELFRGIPLLSWIAISATIASSAHAYRRLMRSFESAPEREPFAAIPWSAPNAAGREQDRYVAAMFVISGFAGLMYQVLFSKALALVFGGTSTAAYTVLATYMGGMAVGAWLGGKLAESRREPLLLYAGCELGIGLYCAATPWIFQVVQALYVAAAGGVAPEAAELTALRVALGAAALTLPTILMGMTLPILARLAERRSISLGRSVAVLYGANTLGAAFGALLAGYFVLPLLGVNKTTLLTVAANLLVVLMALNLYKRSRLGSPIQPLPAAAASVGTAAGEGAQALRLGRIAIVSLTIGGGVTLALEVIYVHLLAVVAGNSTYAFSLMLFTFLLGLGAGAAVAWQLLRLALPVERMLAWLEFALAGVMLLGVYLWGAMPGYFADFSSYPLARGFGARELVRGAVCMVAMFPPAFIIGAIYPVAMECVGRAWPLHRVRALGFAAALNTVGNISGVLLAGFVLLPQAGALRSVQILAFASLLVGAGVLLAAPRGRRGLAWAPAVLVLALLGSQPGSFDYASLATGANVYFAKLSVGRIIDHAESVDGGLTSVGEATTPQGNRLRTLYTNGKFQGNNATEGEMMAKVGFAVAPLLHTAKRERAMVIGYGTGVSARTLHAAGFRDLDIVELSADIVALANRHFREINGAVTTRDGVHTHITDGRNFLLLQDRMYDLVSVEVTSIWFAGAGSLYNREFYQLVKRRLRSDGMLQQWVQLHHIYPADLLTILASVRSEFRYVWLYYIGGQGIVVASNSAASVPSDAHVAALDGLPTLKPLLALHQGGAGSLRKMVLLDPADCDRLIGSSGIDSSFLISTDDNLRLEFNTPRGNVLDGAQSLRDNLQFIMGARFVK